jgi:lipoyl-dependent peroxiredoxin
MAARSAIAIWDGTLQSGGGRIQFGNGLFEAPYSFGTRFHEGESGVNPEMLLAAACAGSYSMALASEFREIGYDSVHVETHVDVHLRKTDEGFEIGRIDISAEAEVPDLPANVFERIAFRAKQACPLSRLAATTEVSLQTRLVSPQAV